MKTRENENAETWGRTNNEAYICENNGTQEHHAQKTENQRLNHVSDDRIRKDIQARLLQDNFVDASGIEVVVLDGEVTLFGKVSEAIDKQRAKDILESISGVVRVDDQIRVKS